MNWLVGIVLMCGKDDFFILDSFGSSSIKWPAFSCFLSVRLTWLWLLINALNGVMFLSVSYYWTVGSTISGITVFVDFFSYMRVSNGYFLTGFTNASLRRCFNCFFALSRVNSARFYETVGWNAVRSCFSSIFFSYILSSLGCSPNMCFKSLLLEWTIGLVGSV